MIDSRVRVTLEALKDGKWRNRFPQKAITPRVLEGCLDLKLVKRKLTKIKGKPHHFHGHFKITRKGRKALKEGEYPTREQINYTMRYGA